MAECSASPSVATSSCDPGLSSPLPSTILKDVVAYVEVRTTNDNRSSAVRWMLERMGARVEEKLTDDVTHVIFKEGKKRTLDKAKKMGVHLVSVLWVDCCKERQQRVAESLFSANTERCGTPPPGVRWKKYKSMQPRDFDVEVARSAERCQKRQQKKTTFRHLLQGGESGTPFHSPAHVFVVDTQPRSPFCSFEYDLQTPVVIPNTPPSMQARLDQLNRDREAKARGESVQSPLCVGSNLGLQSLQKALFQKENDTPSSDDTSDQAASQEAVKDKPSNTSRRSVRISGRVSKNCLPPDDCKKQSRSQSTEKVKAQVSSKQKVETKTTTMSKTESQKNRSSVVDLMESFTTAEKETQRRKTIPETCQSPQNKTQSRARQRRKPAHQSLPCSLSQTSKTTLSQSNKSSALNNCDTVNKGSPVRSTNSGGISGRLCSQNSQVANADGVKKKAGSMQNNDVLTTWKQKTTNRVKGRKTSPANQDTFTLNQVDIAGPNKDTTKPQNRKKRLLNPSQSAHILSPTPIDNSNLSVAQEKRGRKRKSYEIDAIFPSSFPTRKKGRESVCTKKKHLTTLSPIQDNITSNEQSMTKGRTKGKANSSRSVCEAKENDNVTLCSMSQTSSILGSSMSMFFNDSLRPLSGKFAPPRNSLAEFKPKRQYKRGSGKQGSSSQLRTKDSVRASQQMFRTCMPSLVMTSLHRQEQDFVVSAVKRLGVFRIEDKVSQHTTHVICGEARRTLNVLHGLAHGCWLVSKEWIEQSAEDGHWVSEEDFEMTEAFPACKEARLARETEHSDSYVCHIFDAVGSFFVSNDCTPPRHELIKLLKLCGGKVTDSIHRADFYLGDNCHDDKNSIKPIWVLDCISQQKLLPMNDYVLAINYRIKPSSSPQF